MKQKSTIDAVEQQLEERRNELIDRAFQDREMLGTIVHERIHANDGFNAFGCKELSFLELLERDAVSFVRDLHQVHSRMACPDIQFPSDILRDRMRRAGESIVKSLYDAVRYSITDAAYKGSEHEFPDLKVKRLRFSSVLEQIKKSRNENHCCRLAGRYAFEEERMQYADDAMFLETVVPDDFKGHVEALRKKGCWRVDVASAVEIATGLLTSGRMKGKNFRKPVVTTQSA